MHKFGRAITITTLLALFACTSGSPMSDPKPKPRSDSGVTNMLDAGMPDSGPATETTVCGPRTPGGMEDCCPVDGKGCGTQTCFYTTGAINEPQCRDISMSTVAHGEECDNNLNNCESGFTCVQIDAMLGSRCLKVCRANNNADCSSVVDPMTGAAYSCLFTFQENTAWGLCLPTPTECVPYADNCPMGEHCEVISNSGQKGCVPDGTQAVGQPCGDMIGACQRGGICVNLDGTPKCYEPCDPANQMSCSSATAKCSGELSNGTTSLGFGVCGESSCNPVTVETDCAMGENCELVGSALQCVPEGPNMSGQACGGATGQCQRGSICINLSGAMGPQCYEVCDPMNPMCSSGGACQGLVGLEGWGICG